MALQEISGNLGEAMAGVLKEAESELDKCSNIVVIMQKKDGGLLWFAPAEETLASLVYLLEMLKVGLLTAKPIPEVER